MAFGVRWQSGSGDTALDRRTQRGKGGCVSQAVRTAPSPLPLCRRTPRACGMLVAVSSQAAIAELPKGAGASARPGIVPPLIPFSGPLISRKNFVSFKRPSSNLSLFNRVVPWPPPNRESGLCPESGLCLTATYSLAANSLFSPVNKGVLLLNPRFGVPIWCPKVGPRPALSSCRTVNH
jgi:hypothetical protein